MKRIFLNLVRANPLKCSSLSISSFIHKPIFSLSYQPKSFKFATNQSNFKNQFHSKFQGPGFYVQQMLAGCLSLYSYYIQSANQCFIIDPQNDITKYIEIIQRRKKILKGVFLTHYHADFIAGHRELQQKYGCNIYMGPKAIENQRLFSLKDGQILPLGQITVQLIHTPGHTNESICLLLYDKNKKQTALFSGDTLFINEVGRPDLAVSQNVTANQLAQVLYDSLQKLKGLNDDVRVYPGHGAGSSCGKSIGCGDFCTIGNQKKNNYALNQKDKKNFAKLILNQMPKPPQYFGYDAKINKFSPFSYQQAYQKAYTQLRVNELHQIMEKQQPIIIDVRSQSENIKKGILKGSICIGFEGAFAMWVGTLLNPSDKYVIYGQTEQIEDTIRRLLRIGYINILGYAKFDIEQWKNKNFPFHAVQQLHPNIIEEGRYILDVRKPVQWQKGVLNVKDIIKFELLDLSKNVSKLDKTKKYSIHCARGYRARIAYSILKNNGYDAKYYPDAFQTIATLSKVGLKK